VTTTITNPIQEEEIAQARILANQSGKDQFIKKRIGTIFGCAISIEVHAEHELRFTEAEWKEWDRRQLKLEFSIDSTSLPRSPNEQS